MKQFISLYYLNFGLSSYIRSNKKDMKIQDLKVFMLKKGKQKKGSAYIYA